MLRIDDTIPIVGHAVLHYTKPDGKVGWVRTIRNGVTIEGCNWILNTEFRGGPQSTTIYAGLINNASYSSVSPNDQHASHPGWTELASITVATRPIWVPQPASGGILGTLTAPSFTFTANGFIRGAFLSNIAAVGSTAAGILYNTAVAIAPLAVASGGTLNISFNVRIGG